MVKPAKLYPQLLESQQRGVSFRDFVALIEAFGFRHARTRGSHSSYFHPSCRQTLIIQPLGSEAKRYQVRQFLDIVEQAGLSLES